MTDQEILEKYRETIEKNITEKCKQHNIKDDFAKQAYSDAYNREFVKKFREGQQSAKVMVARNMLKMAESKYTVEFIAKMTKLTVEEVKKIQEDIK